MILNIIIISVSLSIDAFGIGVAYHLKGIKIGVGAKCIIGLISSVIMWLSLMVGDYMTRILPAGVMNVFGISILILMGVIFIRNSLFNDEGAAYDFDQSKKIDGFEASILGFALSADSISAGIAVAAIGLNSIFIPIVVGLMQMFFLGMGYLLVEKSLFIQRLNSRVCGVFSGLLLILIAILRAIG